MVVWRLVDGKSELLIPKFYVSNSSVEINARTLPPSRCLSSSPIRGGLPRLLAQSRRTIGILLPHCPPIRQVLRPVHHHHQRPNLRSVNGHVRIDARSMNPVEISLPSRHLEYVVDQYVKNDRKD